MITETCDLPPCNPTPKCACWGQAKTKENLWLDRGSWIHTMFVEVPPAYSAGMRMKICETDPRMAHMIIADGGQGLDFPIIVNPDPATPDKIFFSQQGICSKCMRYEWKRYLENRPSSPLAWVDCTKKTRSRKPKKQEI